MFLGRVVGPGDPAWTDEDQDKALAFEKEQNRLCRGCGTRPEEWDEKLGGDRFAYVANHRYCPGCEVLHQEGRNIGEGRESFTFPYLEPREVAERRELESVQPVREPSGGLGGVPELWVPGMP